jgi:glutamate formiminotransferase/glutamate formiminotransferase/formiminotetrahydrofolate cyclodeaminase
VTTLLAVPNVSEGRDPAVLDAIGAAFAAGGARVLDVHADPDHHRAVFTLAGAPGRLAHAVAAGAREAVARIDLDLHGGLHPRVGAIDVAPVVHLDAARRGAACAEALVLADLLGRDLGLPVLLYGLLAGGRTRAELRRGGLPALGRRIAQAELVPDAGPAALHPSAGAVLVAARPPLVAFNVELAPPATLADARAIAARIRAGGAEGLPGVRAIGLELPDQGIVQVSTNVEDPELAGPAAVVAAVARHAPVARAELVGLAPHAAFAGFPSTVEVRGLRTVEDALES